MVRIIIVYCYYVIFAGWILNLAHIPSGLARVVIQIADVLPFILLAFAFKLKRSREILPDTVSFWLLLLLFLIHSALTTLIHGGRLSSCFIHFGALFRYVPLAAFLSFHKLSEKNIRELYANFKIISAILLMIGVIEVVGGRSVYQYFMPVTEQNSSINLLFTSQIEGNIFGVFPNTVDYSFFLFLSFVVISYYVNDRHRYFFLCCLYLVLIWFSGSKATLIIFMISLIWKTKRYRYTLLGATLALCAVLLVQFWELFYWTVFLDSQSSRLGYLIFTFPDFMSELSFDTFFGVSPDKSLAFIKINSYSNSPLMTHDIEHMTSFEDEFYVALPVYYGVIGFSLIIYLFAKLRSNLIKLSEATRLTKYKKIIIPFFICILIAPFFNQIIIIKPFALFFWIVIGIILNRLRFAEKTILRNA